MSQTKVLLKEERKSETKGDPSAEQSSREKEQKELEVNPKRRWVAGLAQRDNKAGFSEFLLDDRPEEQRSALFPAGRFPHDKDQVTLIDVEADGRALKIILEKMRKELEQFLLEQTNCFNPHTVLLIISSLKDVVNSLSQSKDQSQTTGAQAVGVSSRQERRNLGEGSLSKQQTTRVHEVLDNSISEGLARLDDTLSKLDYLRDRLCSKTGLKVDRHLINQIESLGELKDKLEVTAVQLRNLQAGNKKILSEVVEEPEVGAARLDSRHERSARLSEAA